MTTQNLRLDQMSRTTKYNIRTYYVAERLLFQVVGKFGEEFLDLTFAHRGRGEVVGMLRDAFLRQKIANMFLVRRDQFSGQNVAETNTGCHNLRFHTYLQSVLARHMLMRSVAVCKFWNGL
jgi:hypothetical protein